MSTLSVISDAGAAGVPLNRDVFLRTLIRELARTPEDVVGLKDASGYISVVGQKVGEQIDRHYRAAFQAAK